MTSIFVARGTAEAIPIWFVTAASYPELRERLERRGPRLCRCGGLRAQARPPPAAAGSGPGSAACCSGWKPPTRPKDLFRPGLLPQQLPDGVYRFANDPHDARLAALAFALGSYRFTLYRKAERRQVKLELAQSIDRDDLDRTVEAVTLARDLINTPANDMGPAELEARRAFAGRAPRRRHPGDGRQRSFGGEFSADPCRWPRVRTGAAADRAEMGREGASPGHAGRQGRVLRLRRSRHQARERDALDEEGHGRSGERAGARAHDHGPRPESPADAC